MREGRKGSSCFVSYVNLMYPIKFYIKLFPTREESNRFCVLVSASRLKQYILRYTITDGPQSEL